MFKSVREKNEQLRREYEARMEEQRRIDEERRKAEAERMANRSMLPYENDVIEKEVKRALDWHKYSPNYESGITVLPTTYVHVFWKVRLDVSQHIVYISYSCDKFKTTLRVTSISTLREYENIINQYLRDYGVNKVQEVFKKIHEQYKTSNWKIRCSGDVYVNTCIF